MVFRVSSLGLCLSSILLAVPQYTQAATTSVVFANINTGKASSMEAAQAYLSGLNGGFQLAKQNRSILGKHFYFQQVHNGIPIDKAEVVISVRDSDLGVYRIFNNAVPQLEKLSIDEITPISQSQAYDIAWKDLRVSGPLMSAPKIELVYQKRSGNLDLVYKIRLAVSEPFGYWEYVIHAVSGKIIKKGEVSLSRMDKKATRTKAFRAQSGALLDRYAEFSEYAHWLQNEEDEPAVSYANGKALVFDPDPRTALNDNTLEDDSPAAKFDSAYVSRVLRDLSVKNGKFVLQGPWVQIADFEPPSMAPTTTSDGNWSFKRGSNGFNDVMTYFHIDQNQRYMQSLGFVGEKGIQNRSIAIDSDGVNGDDNSHFIPGENRIAFGHGCVDDNEDADVILHEYGHAIQDAINRNWDGGDTGAMGEGFGDYWATSYSLSTQNGMSFQSGNVFNWDAGGQSSRCWPGRRVNVENARYEHSRTYQAHQQVGTFVSDELWSTPLVQSLRELISLGYPRARVDQIVLEAHFGLGANLKMRDMANAIVQTAQKLYPNDPYASVFTKHFVKHNILEIPHATLELKQVSLVNAGQNRALDPGETVELSIVLANSGTLDARAIRGRISSPNPDLTIAGSEFGFADIAVGGQQNNTGLISLTLSSFATCGGVIDVLLDVDFEGGTGSVRLPMQISVGVARVSGGTANHQPGAGIPDNDPKGFVSSLWLNDEGKITDAKGLTVSLDLAHNYPSDLKISLIAPSGKTVVLHNPSSANRSLVGTFPTTLTPVDSLSKLVGESLKGEWKLKAVDNVAYDAGTLKSWGLNAVLGYECAVPSLQ